MAHPLPSNLISGNYGLVSGAAKWAFDVTSGLFWAFMLLGFSVVLYISSSQFGQTRAFGFAAFVGMIGAIFLTMIGLIAWPIASMFIIVGVIGLGMMVLSER